MGMNPKSGIYNLLEYNIRSIRNYCTSIMLPKLQIGCLTTHSCSRPQPGTDTGIKKFIIGMVLTTMFIFFPQLLHGEVPP